MTTPPPQLDSPTQIGTVHFKNRLVLASGMLGNSAEWMVACLQSGAAAVTTASLMVDPETHQLSHRSASIIAAINQVGKDDSAVVIANIAAYQEADYATLAKAVQESAAKMIEVYIHEPDVYQPERISSIVRAITAVTELPISVKLSPVGWNIEHLVQGSLDAGASAVTAITGLPGTVKNAPIHDPYANYVSGAPIKPVAVKTVQDITSAMPDVPVIATGGVRNIDDAKEMLSVGGSLVGIGTAAFTKGPAMFKQLLAS